MQIQQNNDNMTDTHNRSHKAEVGLIIVAVVLIVLLGLGWWWFWGRAPQQTTQELSPGVNKRAVEAGNIVPGFPSELIQEPGVITKGSYAIDYVNQNRSQPVVRYISRLSMKENVDRYGAYLDEEGWGFIHNANPLSSTNTYYYAYRENSEVNIMFVQNDDDTVEVNIAYLTDVN